MTVLLQVATPEGESGKDSQLRWGLPVSLPRRGQSAGSYQFADACAPG